MLTYVVANFDAPLTRARVVASVENCAKDFGLHKGIVEEKPTRGIAKNAMQHWHWKRAKVSGTLEVTWHPRENQIVVSVHQNRVGANEWAKRDAPKFAARLAKELNGRVGAKHLDSRM